MTPRNSYKRVLHFIRKKTRLIVDCTISTLKGKSNSKYDPDVLPDNSPVLCSIRNYQYVQVERVCSPSGITLAVCQPLDINRWSHFKGHLGLWLHTCFLIECTDRFCIMDNNLCLMQSICCKDGMIRLKGHSYCTS